MFRGKVDPVLKALSFLPQLRL